MTVIVSEALREDMLRQAEQLVPRNREALTRLFESRASRHVAPEDRVTTRKNTGSVRRIRTAEEFITHVERRMDFLRR